MSSMAIHDYSTWLFQQVVIGELATKDMQLASWKRATLLIYTGFWLLLMIWYLQEIVSIYPFLSPPTLSPGASNRVCNALALLQVILQFTGTFFFISCSTFSLFYKVLVFSYLPCLLIIKKLMTSLLYSCILFIFVCQVQIQLVIVLLLVCENWHFTHYESSSSVLSSHFDTVLLSYSYLVMRILFFFFWFKLSFPS